MGAYKKIAFFLSSIVISLTAISCKTDSIYANYVVESVVATGNEKYLNESSDFIFDQIRESSALNQTSITLTIFEKFLSKYIK